MRLTGLDSVFKKLLFSKTEKKLETITEGALVGIRSTELFFIPKFSHPKQPSVMLKLL